MNGRDPNEAPGDAPGGVPQQHNMVITDAERDSVRDTVLSKLLQGQSQPVDETSRMKFRDISIRLEKGLFEAAHTREDYLNMQTLETRLGSLLRRDRPGNNDN